MLDGPVRSKKELLLRNQLRNALKMQENQENAIQVGGVSFPKSMFRPILGDIDANVMWIVRTLEPLFFLTIFNFNQTMF